MIDLGAINTAALTGRGLILGEGAGDAYFFAELCDRHGIAGFAFNWPEADRVTHTGGIAQYPTFLSGLRSRAGFAGLEALVVTADNDENPAAAFANVQQVLRDAGFAAPPAPLAFVPDSNLKIGVLMFPAAGKTGALESLLMESSKWPQTKIDCLSAFTKCSDIDTYAVQKRDKARVQCTIAASFKAQPGRSLSYVWDKAENPFDIAHRCFDDIVAFLKSA
jgi:hypothetical protein